MLFESVNSPIFWNLSHKNIPDRHQYVQFRKSPTITKSLHPHLEAGEEAVEEGVEVHARLLELMIAGEFPLDKFPAKQLGAEEGKNAEEEKEEDEEGGDGFDGADEGAEQVLQRLPVAGHLEGAQQANAAQDGHAEWRHHVRHGEHHLENRAEHDEEIEAIEERDEVELDAEGVHLEEHLEGEEDDEGEVSGLLEVAQPLGLVVVLGGEDAGVEEHQGHHHPEHGLKKYLAGIRKI